jgi:hypothetical protein
MMPTPPIANAVPNLVLDTLSHPVAPVTEFALTNETADTINNHLPERRRRDSLDSDESYQAPVTRARTIVNRPQSQAQPVAAADLHSKVKNLLKLYAPKLKWQRYPDSRLTTQPNFETQLYHYFNTQSSDDEDFKFLINTIVNEGFLSLYYGIGITLVCSCVSYVL